MAGCSQPTLFRQETIVFGTRVVVTVEGVNEAVADAATRAVFTHFQDMHERFYPWRQGELHHINAHVREGTLPITLSASMAIMFALAKDYAKRSEGLFNPSIGQLVALWGFHRATMPTAPPAAVDIAAWLRSAPSMAEVVVVESRLLSAPTSAYFDFGALAKGVALDAARRLLLAHGVNNALVDVGGNLLAMGRRGNRPWRVSLHADRNKPPLAVITLKSGEAVATSGDSERFFIFHGKRYHHILDPRTGYPAVSRKTAIVISDDADRAGAISDAAATALVIADDASAARIVRNFGVTLWWRRDDKDNDISQALQQRRQAFP